MTSKTWEQENCVYGGMTDDSIIFKTLHHLCLLWTGLIRVESGSKFSAGLSLTLASDYISNDFWVILSEFLKMHFAYLTFLSVIALADPVVKIQGEGMNLIKTPKKTRFDLILFGNWRSWRILKGGFENKSLISLVAPLDITHSLLNTVWSLWIWVNPE